MTKKIKYRIMRLGEESDVYELIVREFRKHVAPCYSEKGTERFLNMLSPEWLRKKRAGKDSLVILALRQSNPVGMLSVINTNHIALIFVDSEYQGIGIGKKLIGEAIRYCVGNHPLTETITVSSSPNSISFYHAVGFQPIGDEVNEDGMRFIPMRRELNQ